MSSIDNKAAHDLSASTASPVSAGLGIEAGGGYGIDLVNEDDGGRILLGQPEDIPHHPWALHMAQRCGLGDNDEEHAEQMAALRALTASCVRANGQQGDENMAPTGQH